MEIKFTHYFYDDRNDCPDYVDHSTFLNIKDNYLDTLITKIMESGYTHERTSREECASSIVVLIYDTRINKWMYIRLRCRPLSSVEEQLRFWYTDMPLKGIECFEESKYYNKTIEASVIDKSLEEIQRFKRGL